MHRVVAPREPMMRKRIFLVGPVHNNYRARALLEYLAFSPSWTYHHSDPQYCVARRRSPVKVSISSIARIIERLLSVPKLVIADVIYVLPMGKLWWVEATIARCLSKRVVVEFYFSLYDTYVNDRKTFPPNSYSAKRLMKHDRRLCDSSTELIFLNRAEKKYYLNVIGRENVCDKARIVPLCTNYMMQAELPYLSSKSDCITIAWWGTYIPLHGVEKILECARFLKRKGVEFRLFIFGTSDDLSISYSEYVSENGMGECVFIDNTKRFSDKTLEKFLIEECDLALGTFGDSAKAKTVMVNKVAEAAAMGIPVLTQRTSALSEFFENDDTIFFVEPNAAAMAEKIEQLLSQAELMQLVAGKAREMHEQLFSRGAYVQAISSILESAS